ncbi:NERD domain-containing protein [Virgibacillus xinjiangensis]|uniref:NERD domain-containing protein n=1 Tax=Virgibacillus xinjiangensis TaxID=393090 RepID=A0ABV7CTF7_9BACI
MLIKRRTKPLLLKKHEALIPRLQRNFPRFDEIEYDYHKYRKGYEGERQVDYYLEIVSDDYTILQDVCLQLRGKTFQMDNLVITPNGIYIIEVKNYEGTIIFDTALNQFTRDDGEAEAVFGHPVTQAEIQKMNLQNWILDKKLPNLPIHYFIAISNPATMIKMKGEASEISHVVTHAAGIPVKIVEMDKRLAQSKLKEHRRLGNLILKECREYDQDIMQKHQLTERALLPGVACPECGQLGMKRIYNNWACTKCKHTSRQAHVQAMEDYRLLIGQRMRNAHCRHWLQLNSKNIATKLMREYGMEYRKEQRCWYKK